LMDEFLGGVGDENFRKKSDEIFQRSFLDGRTIVHVSHNLSTIKKYCDRVILLDKGECIALDKPEIVLDIYENLMK
ncbi:MAG: ABC transporter ATP-binding protein, partial [Bacteroidales bacterium]|nr:ABC transporter ATP-binding protein [Bacteroidales bacterium]